MFVVVSELCKWWTEKNKIHFAKNNFDYQIHIPTENLLKVDDWFTLNMRLCKIWALFFCWNLFFSFL